MTETRQHYFSDNDWMDAPQLKLMPPKHPQSPGTSGSNGSNGGDRHMSSRLPLPYKPFNCTDVGNGELFAYLFSDVVRYDHSNKQWLIWHQNWWANDLDGEVMRKAKESTRQRHHWAADLQATNPERSKLESNWSIASEGEQRICNALRCAQSERPIADTGVGWDADPWLIGVENGVVDLKTGNLRTGLRDDRITKHTSVKYDTGAECPRFISFLDKIFAGNKDLISFIQRAVGYSLVGESRDRAAFICYGKGRNGKSTLLGVMLAIFGEYGKSAAPELFMAKRHDGHPAALADISGARIMVAVETEEGQKLSEGLIKQITGRDHIKARFLYGQYFDFIGIAKPWLSTNHKPVIKGTDNAIWDRIHLIPFSVRIQDDEEDKDLPTKLRSEYPGILRWAVDGCLAYQCDGLGFPAEVKVATDTYRAEMDVLWHFINDHCTLGVGYQVAKAVLYAKYQRWCVDNQEPVISRLDFTHSLEERGVGDKRGTGGIHQYTGIGIKQTSGE